MSVRNRVKSGVAIGASMVGCSSDSGPAAQVESPKSTPPVQVEPAANISAKAALLATAVYTDQVARPLLYTWTSSEQIAALRTDKVLLTRKESPTKGLARFDRSLATMDDPIAKLLKSDGWNRRRFAWTNPWATIRGWPGESYGNQLVEIRIRADAWIAVLVAEACSRTAPRWTFVDMKGNPVDLDAVLAAPDLLAMVFHQSNADPQGGILYCGDSFISPSVPFREFVIVREEMVERWAVGSDDLRNAIAESEANLKEVRAVANAAPMRADLNDSLVWGNRLRDTVWPTAKPPQTALSLYEANLTWGNELYIPTDRRIAELVRELEKARGAQGEELVHTPDASELAAYRTRANRTKATKPAKPAKPAKPTRKPTLKHSGTF